MVFAHVLRKWWVVEEEGLHNETKKRIRKVEKVYVVKQSSKVYVVKQSPLGVAEALPATVSWCLLHAGGHGVTFALLPVVAAGGGKDLLFVADGLWRFRGNGLVELFEPAAHVQRLLFLFCWEHPLR